MELPTQEKVEYGMKIGWTSAALVSTGLAYVFQDQSIAWLGCLFATIVSMIFIVPTWPVWKHTRIEWVGVVEKKE